VQAQFFLAGQLHPDRALNTVTYAQRIEGPLVAEQLGRALEALRDRHPALRTRILARDGVIVRSTIEGSRSRRSRSGSARMRKRPT
jgi:hypothetical protein